MESRRAYLNAVAGVVPEHDVHQLFIDWAEGQVEDPRLRKLFMRMADRSGIEHRWSVLAAGAGRAAAQPAGRLLSRRDAGHLDADAALRRGGAGAGAAGDRQAARAGRARRHHPSRRRQLHRLRRARDRPDHRPPARPRRRRADPGRLHGLLRRGLRAAHRLPYRPLRARARGCWRSPSSCARSTCRRRRSSSRCSPCSSSATAPRRRWSRPSRAASR